jgi:cathepsin B
MWFGGLILGCLLACASRTQGKLSQQQLDMINADATWIASGDAKFADLSLLELQGVLGWKLDNEEALPWMDNQHEWTRHEDDNTFHHGADIPKSFDARQAWPDGQIHGILNEQESGCANDLSISAVEVLSDRLAIANGNSFNGLLSVQQVTSCGVGCDGGFMKTPWMYLNSTGAVSNSCYPITQNDPNQCLWSPHATCASMGGSGDPTLFKARTFYAIQPKNVSAMQLEIMTNGPIDVAFDVYEDFFTYTSGVYVHKTGSLAGGHAVRVLGWGSLNKVEYWICANSWGVDWGMEGYFLIKRGVNECQIESQPFAGMPLIE